MNEKGWTITFIPWENLTSRERVLKRLKTTEEKDEFMKNISKYGLSPEERCTIRIYNDYNYILTN
jgi:hypothetical protein